MRAFRGALPVVAASEILEEHPGTVH